MIAGWNTLQPCLHLLPSAVQAQLDGLVGHERQRQLVNFGTSLPSSFSTASFNARAAGIRRRGVGDCWLRPSAGRCRSRPRPACRRPEHLDAVAIGALTGAGQQLVIRDPGLILHRGRSVAAGLHPQPVDVAPMDASRGSSSAQCAPRLGSTCRTPSAMMWMPGYLANTSFAACVALRIDRGAGHAGDHHEITLAVHLLGQPFGGDPPGLRVDRCARCRRRAR